MRRIICLLSSNLSYVNYKQKDKNKKGSDYSRGMQIHYESTSPAGYLNQGCQNLEDE